MGRRPEEWSHPKTSCSGAGLTPQASAQTGAPLFSARVDVSTSAPHPAPATALWNFVFSSIIYVSVYRTPQTPRGQRHKSFVFVRPMLGCGCSVNSHRFTVTGQDQLKVLGEDLMVHAQ